MPEHKPTPQALRSEKGKRTRKGQPNEKNGGSWKASERRIACGSWATEKGASGTATKRMQPSMAGVSVEAEEARTPSMAAEVASAVARQRTTTYDNTNGTKTVGEGEAEAEQAATVEDADEEAHLAATTKINTNSANSLTCQQSQISHLCRAQAQQRLNHHQPRL
jgi:hypothetical protein